MGLLLVYCGFFEILLPSKPAFWLCLFSFRIRQSTEVCINLVQISTRSDLSKHIRLLSFPFRHCCSKTFITFRMSTALFPLPRSRHWANYPTTFTFIGVLGSLFALSSSVWKP